jgi:hypothetical protein
MHETLAPQEFMDPYLTPGYRPPTEMQPQPGFEAATEGQIEGYAEQQVAEASAEAALPTHEVSSAHHAEHLQTAAFVPGIAERPAAEQDLIAEAIEIGSLATKPEEPSFFGSDTVEAATSFNTPERHEVSHELVIENAKEFIARPESVRAGTEILDTVEGRERRPAFDVEISPGTAEAVGEFVSNRSETVRETQALANKVGEVFEDGKIKGLTIREVTPAEVGGWVEKYEGWQATKAAEAQKRAAETPVETEITGFGFSAFTSSTESVLTEPLPQLAEGRVDLIKAQELLKRPENADGTIIAIIDHLSSSAETAEQARVGNIELIDSGQWPNDDTFARVDNGYRSPAEIGRALSELAREAGLVTDSYNSEREQVSIPKEIQKGISVLLEKKVGVSFGTETGFLGNEGGWLADVYRDATDVENEEALIGSLEQALGAQAPKFESVLGEAGAAESLVRACNRLILAEVPLIHATSAVNAAKMIRSGKLVTRDKSGVENAGPSAGGVHWASPGYASPGYGTFQMSHDIVLVGMSLGDIVAETPIYTQEGRAGERLTELSIGGEVPLALQQNLAKAQELLDGGLRVYHIAGGGKAANSGPLGDSPYEMLFAKDPSEVAEGDWAQSYEYELKEAAMLADKPVIDGELRAKGISEQDLAALMLSPQTAPTVHNATTNYSVPEELWFDGKDMLRQVAQRRMVKPGRGRTMLIAPVAPQAINTGNWLARNAWEAAQKAKIAA